MVDLKSLNLPGPTVTRLSAPFWEAAENGKLLIQHCGNCQSHVFYPRALCPHCWSSRLDWKEASGRGRLKSYSCVHRPGHPAWQPVAPYIVGLVELAEGPTMLSFIHAAGEGIAVGDFLELAPTRLGGRMLPAFQRA
jgi:uncharacterized OB-fold protein